MQLHFAILSLLYLFLGSTVAKNKLVYIYEFPEPVVNTWVPLDLELRPETVWKHEFNRNEGFGTPHTGTSYFETWQYSSFRLILSRLLRSKYRTRNISEASVFVIPYDSGSECYVDEVGNYRQHGNPLGDVVIDLLQKKPYIKANLGYDHLLIHSSSLVAHQMSVKLKAIFSILTNATIATVERLPRVHRWIREQPFIQPIPMASMYHWQESKGRRNIPALRPLSMKKSIFISYFGSSQTSKFPYHVLLMLVH